MRRKKNGITKIVEERRDVFINLPIGCGEERCVTRQRTAARETTLPPAPDYPRARGRVADAGLNARGLWERDYGFRMIDRFLNWGDHRLAKSGKIKDSCQPPPCPQVFLPIRRHLETSYIQRGRTRSERHHGPDT